MRLIASLLSLVLFGATLVPAPALAISDAARIDQLERDLEGLQRSVYSSGGKVSGGLNTADASAQVRFGQMDERLRAIEGRLEELDFQNKQLKEQLERSQKDNEMRFGDLEKRLGVTVVAPIATPVSAVSSATNIVPTPTITTPVTLSAAPIAVSSDPQILHPQQTTPNASGQFASAHDHYDYAFRLLNQTQYDQAAQAFKGFIAAYPKDPLVGNAYYWTGETYYVQQKYEDAVDNFRLGFENMPTGPKAGDNLLKLSMSLSALNRNDEACVVLSQVVNKFGANSISLKNKALAERSRIGCK